MSEPYADSAHRWAANEDASRPVVNDRCLTCGGIRWGDKAVGPECIPSANRWRVSRRGYLILRAMEYGADIFTATEAVATTAIEHPEWDMSEERTLSEWDASEHPSVRIGSNGPADAANGTEGNPMGARE